MTLELGLFIFLGALLVISSILVITARNAVYSVLFLVVNFGALAGVYLLLYAQFLAVVQVIVYAGAIMVLFLFIIMLLQPDKELSYFKYKPGLKVLAIIAGLFLLAQLGFIILMGEPSAYITRDIQQSIEIGTVEAIGMQLYTTYLLPFEAIAFLLVAATVGALILAKKKITHD